MNNNSQNSVVASQAQSKKHNRSQKRQSRQESYRGKFSSHSHMIIPQEDFIWTIDKPNSVKTLFAECWISDPYGSRPMQLNHSLKPSSFKVAKKAIADAGLFTFESKRSIRDGRESVCWMVVNLHGSRRNDFWLGQQKIEASHLTKTANNLADKANNLADKASHLASISIETQSEQGFQNPSETSQEHLSNSSKELLEVLEVEKGVDDRDRSSALEGQTASASSPEEKSNPTESDLVTKSNLISSKQGEVMHQDISALTNKSTTKHSDMEIQDLVHLDIESMTLDELQKLPRLENRGVETTGKMSKAVRDKKILDFQLRGEYTSRVHQAISKRLDEEIATRADKSMPSPLTNFKERLNAKFNAEKFSERKRRLKGEDTRN